MFCLSVALRSNLPTGPSSTSSRSASGYAICQHNLRAEEGIKKEGLEQVIGAYLFTEKTPKRDDVIGVMEKRTTLRERRSVADRIIEQIKSFVETFIDGVD